MECEKYRSTQEQAYVFLKEAERFEFFTKQGVYTDEDVRRGMNFRVLSEKEASKFLKTKAVTYVSLNDIFDLYDTYAKKHWGANTYKSYMSTTRKILKVLGDIKITNLEEYRKAVEGHVEEMSLEDKLSNRTKNIYLDRIRQMIGIAISENAFPFKDNPIDLIEKYPDSAVRLPRALSYDEAKDLLQQAKERKGIYGLFYEMTITFLFCGLRLSEVKYLTYDDVLDDRIKIQPKSVLPSETEEELKDNIWQPKTGSTRVIFIEDSIWREKVIQRIRNVPKAGRFVFSPENRTINKYVIDSAYNDRLFKKMDISLHCLRHTFISWRIECGDPLPRVMRLAGHRNIETTMRYTHISEKKMRDIINLL